MDKSEYIMIRNKDDYKYFLEADRIALSISKHRSIKDLIIKWLIGMNEVWEFQKALRTVEYLQCINNRVDVKIRYVLAYRKLHKMSIRLGFNIHPHNFGPGLSIAHPGPIIVNPAARVGANCRIHPCTVIGTKAGFSDKAAQIGDNVYIGPGVKISGEVVIADNIAIGANSVVNKSFLEPGITIAGVPAKKVSDKSSDGLLIKGSVLDVRD